MRGFLWIWSRGHAEPEDPVVEAPAERRQDSSRSSHHRLQFYRRQLEPGEETGAVGVLEEPAAELLISSVRSLPKTCSTAHWLIGRSGIAAPPVVGRRYCSAPLKVNRADAAWGPGELIEALAAGGEDEMHRNPNRM
jgi:hypothetical protein